MWIVAAVIIGLVVVAIAFGAVGREVVRLSNAEPRPTFEVETAVLWMGDHLDETVTSQISYDELTQLVEEAVRQLRSMNLVVTQRTARGDKLGETDVDLTSGQRLSLDQLAEALEPAASEIGVDPSFVGPICAVIFEYLEAIGAIGPQAA